MVADVMIDSNSDKHFSCTISWLQYLLRLLRYGMKILKEWGCFFKYSLK